MIICSSCGQANPEGARFCNACAAALESGAREARKERKIVTVLFVDLVGFTSRAEQLDPEDVRAVLDSYQARVRHELERLGATVEKFIGDAVMALFGAPTAHEDDPERAVRAALAIRDWAREESGDLQVRIAVNTGEALVSLGARTSEGEGMAAGDVVNTAARLQAAASANGILVGEPTYEATRNVIDYRPHEPVQAKGKSAPVPVWEAVQARSRVQVDRPGGAALVGREKELALLGDALDRARSEREPQLVTLVGVPGIGKSRLVFELYRAIEETPELVFWRRGRSLPYGEGVTFWALGEVVKAQAGILESDSIEDAEEKLTRSIRDLLHTQADRRWVQGHLRPLVGVGREDELAGERREEAFAAWRRFLEALAERRPLVLVFEDLHWADEALLDFVDELVEWTSGVPLLVLCTARPEFLARRPGWGGGKPNALTLSLAPLSEQETAQLVHDLLGRAALRAETQSALLARAGGNPLYAEEFVRLAQERGFEEPALPGSVQGIIAARLDGLDPAEKRLLQHAAVLGKVFWAGALARIAGLDRREVERGLHALERKEFVRRARRASVEGETEYDFRHILVRDVAYGQIPRGERAETHRLTAEWIESLGRPDDHAEMLAHHFVTALELNRAAGKDDPMLAAQARPALRAAGDRALALAAFEAAARFYASALDLCPMDDPERPQLLLRRGRAMFFAEGSGLELLTEALDAFRSWGDDEGAAEAATAAGNLLFYRGERDQAYACVDEAVELISQRPPSFAKANALLVRSGFHLVTGEFPETLRLAREALPMVERLGLDALHARALNLIGWSRVGTGDTEGLRDLELAVEIALKANSYEHLATSFENLRSAQFALGLLAEESASLRRHSESAERLVEAHRRWLRVLRAAEAFRQGRWDEAFQLADAFLHEVEAGSPHYLEPPCRTLRASMRLARGDVSGAASDTQRALEVARRSKDFQVLSHALCARAIVALVEDRRREAAELASELAGSTGVFVFGMTFGWPTLADVAWVLRDLDRLPDLVQILDAIPVATPWAAAARAIADGAFASAAEILGRMGHAAGEADARLRTAEALVTAGRRVEADDLLASAVAFYRSVGAGAYVQRGEALLAASA